MEHYLYVTLNTLEVIFENLFEEKSANEFLTSYDYN
jgi:hypothetical protein